MRSLTVAAQQAINNTEKEKALVTAALVARQLQVLLICCALLCRWQIPLKSKTKHLINSLTEIKNNVKDFYRSDSGKYGVLNVAYRDMIASKL